MPFDNRNNVTNFIENIEILWHYSLNQKYDGKRFLPDKVVTESCKPLVLTAFTFREKIHYK